MEWSAARFHRWLWSLAGGALLLRLVVCWELGSWNQGRNSVFFPSPLSDLHTYMELGRQVAAGTFSGEFYYQPFYYAVFLPLVYLTTGYAATAVILAQAVLGALTVAIVGYCGARIWSRRAGLWAAGLTAISTPLLLYTPFAQNETLQTFNLALLLLLTLRCRRNPRWYAFLLTGVVGGVAILTRGNAWCFLPGILWFLARRRWNRRTVGGLGLLLLALLAVQLPFAWRNTRLRGALAGPSTAAGAVLALGNTPEAPPGGRNPGLPAGPMEYPPSYADFMAREAAGRPVALQIADWFRREPGAVIELYWRKFLLFWDYREIPNNVSLYGEGEHSLLLRTLLPGRSGLLLALGVAGMLLALRRWRRPPVALLYYFVGSYVAATVVFYILSRFRAPILPGLALFGGIFVDGCLRLDRHRFRVLALPALVFGVWLTFAANDLYRERLEAAVMRLVRPDGVRYPLLDGRRMLLDHGPQTNGGWRELALKSGDRIHKSFPGVTAPRGRVEWSLLAGETGARLRLRANGETKSVVLPPMSLTPLAWELPLNGGELEFEVLAQSGQAFLLYDEQRRYGRSGALPGELVMRLILPPDSETEVIR